MTRLKLYALAVVGAVLAVFGIRSVWIDEGADRERAKQRRQKLDKIKDASDVRNEVEALDRDTLEQRARRWVRGKND